MPDTVVVAVLSLLGTLIGSFGVHNLSNIGLSSLKRK